MKKSFTKIALIALVSIFSVVSVVSAAETDYGAAGAMAKESYTIGEMLTYAIQDEYLARAEYEKIIETYGEQRPFSNIIEAEETHIALLKPLFEKYGITVPEDNAKERTIVPNSLTDAFKTGIQAEVDNIAMYDKFLKQDMSEDIKGVFVSLKSASQNHLRAFENGAGRGSGPQQWKNNGAGGGMRVQSRNR